MEESDTLSENKPEPKLIDKESGFGRFKHKLYAVLLVFLGAILGYAFAPEKVVEKVLERPVYTTVVERVQTEKINEQSTNIALFTGHYLAHVDDYYGEESTSSKTVTCHTLVVDPPNNDLTEYFISLIQVGNTVQSRNSDGKLILHLPWEDIPESDKERIAQATTDPITLILQKKSQGGKGAPPCYSLVSYIGIK